MANNFNDATVAVADDALTDIYTATNKSLVIAGTISNTTTTSMNVTMKKYDASATTSFSIFTTVPLTSGSSLELPKVILQTSDKIQVQTDDASGNCTVALQLLTDVS